MKDLIGHLTGCRQTFAPNNECSFNCAQKHAYKQGFLDGLYAYAYMRDGVYYVGTNGKTFEEAKAEIEESWNYKEEIES